MSAYHGEIVGAWEPLVGEETWRAVRGILPDPARKPPKGVRTLLGGLARCPCGNVVSGMPSHTGRHVYRCAPVTHAPAWPGGHVSRQSAPAEDFIVKLVIARLSRPDAAAIRRNLEERAADRAPGLINRAQMLAATSRVNGQLAEIGAQLDSAARENVLTPLVAAENAAAVWEDLDLAVKRAVIRTLMTITLRSEGSGTRTFDPDTVTVDWRRQGRPGLAR